ncbi:hypothetical protein KYC5002_45915 [Archangium violaceum]|uniref:hypothetical protein n=1 Tax=Archangium violaceum TaxID=83451 RepID=UPI002B2FFF00|nr:hypothetical protein KYC5002_45915 [Archangium gephyra]
MEGEVPRLSSGTPYLDQILAGGWLRGGTYNERGVSIHPRWEAVCRKTPVVIATKKTPKLLQALKRRSRQPGGRE